MLRHTRRRALGLLIAACAGSQLAIRMSTALAQDGEDPEGLAPEVLADDDGRAPEDEEPDCFETKQFGPWTAQATDVSAGATQRDLQAADPKPCDLSLEFQVNTNFDARIFVEGSPDGTPLPEAFLVQPENRLIAKATGDKAASDKAASDKTASDKTASGQAVVDEALCGNCTDIYDDTVSIVLPLATAPLLRDAPSMELAFRLQGKDEDCRFEIDCVTMREALDWATEQRDALAARRDDNECASAEGCFITTACCDVLGLDDDCFELRTLRRFRDEVLAKKQGGRDAIACYYMLAPAILNRLRATSADPDAVLLSVYARFVLPAAMAARLGLNGLAYRLYARMLAELTEPQTGPTLEAQEPEDSKGRKAVSSGISSRLCASK